LRRKTTEVAASVALLAIVAYFLWEARDWQIRAGLGPWSIGFVMLPLALLQVGVAVRALVRAPNPAVGAAPADKTTADAASVDDAVVRRRALFIIAWTIGFFLGLWLLGFRLASPLLTFAFLRFGARESLRTAALFALGTYLCVVLVFQAGVKVPFPPGLLWESLGLQSPDAVLFDSLLGAVLQVLDR
jgi:hypothetical protein